MSLFSEQHRTSDASAQKTTVPVRMENSVSTNQASPGGMSDVTVAYEDPKVADCGETSPGGRSDATVAYDDPKVSTPTTPSPRAFQSPVSTNDSVVRNLSFSGADEPPTATSSPRPALIVSDPVHEPTPSPTVLRSQSSSSTANTVSDPVHMPSPQRVGARRLPPTVPSPLRVTPSPEESEAPQLDPGEESRNRRNLHSSTEKKIDDNNHE